MKLPVFNAVKTINEIGVKLYKRGETPYLVPADSNYLNKILYFLNAIYLVKHKTSLLNLFGSCFQKGDTGPILSCVYSEKSYVNGDNYVDSNYVFRNINNFKNLLHQNITLSYPDDDVTNFSMNNSENKVKTDFFNKYLKLLLQFSPRDLEHFSKQELQWRNTDRSHFKLFKAYNFDDDINAESTKLYSNIDANYRDEETYNYYKQPSHQFWNNIPHDTKLFYSEMSNPKLSKVIKKAIRLELNNSLLLSNFKKDTLDNCLKFKATTLNHKFDKQFKLTKDDFSGLYTLSYDNSDNQATWLSHTLIDCFSGCEALQFPILCNLHRNFVYLSEMQGAYISKMNKHNNAFSRWENIYRPWIISFYKLGNFALPVTIIANAHAIGRIHKYQSFLTNCLHQAFKYTSVDTSTNGSLPAVTNISSSSMKKLDTLIGLKSVKRQMKIYIRSAKVSKRMRELGQDSQMKSLDMIFLGNPGTGKTVVARLVGKILYENHVIQKDKFLECSANDLIGAYNGWTGPKTDKLIHRALGGVLFIDEAYTLAPSEENAGGGNDYKKTAISELLRQAENHRDDLVIILAGYKDKMENLMQNSNQGLKSRFNHKILFPDYTNQEMLDIFKLHAKQKAHLQISDKNYQYIAKKLPDFIKYAKKQGDNSNGRLMRNLLQAVIESRNYRIGNKVGQMDLSQIDQANLSDIKGGFKEAYENEKNSKSKAESKKERSFKANPLKISLNNSHNL